MYCCFHLIYTRCDWLQWMETEKCHECANIGKQKRLKLCWQLYVTWLSVRDLENFRPMDFCSTECTRLWTIKRLNILTTVYTPGDDTCYKCKYAHAQYFELSNALLLSILKAFTYNTLAHYTLLTLNDALSLCVAVEQFAPASSNPVIPHYTQQPTHRASHVYPTRGSPLYMWSVDSWSTHIFPRTLLHITITPMMYLTYLVHGEESFLRS